MGLYAKIDEQIGNFYGLVSIKKSLSEQYFYLQFLVFLLLYFNVFMILKCFI